jgi:hypothetical protein
MNRPGFTFGWALGFLEMLGTCVFSALERYTSFPRGVPSISKTGTSSNKLDYAIVVICLMSSSSLSNIALNYINFPTKVWYCVLVWSWLPNGFNGVSL